MTSQEVIELWRFVYDDLVHIKFRDLSIISDHIGRGDNSLCIMLSFLIAGFLEWRLS